MTARLGYVTAQRRTRSVWVAAALCALAAAPAVAPAVAAGLPDATYADGSCARHEIMVDLVPEDPADHRLVGWLCAAAPYAGQTVIIASPTGLSTHAYWDWPQDPETYSFVRHATSAGYAVFNYDRIGTGESDRPNAALVTVESEAHVLHQLVSRLRDGDVGGTPFGKVVLLGNSISTFISVFEAATYRDVDGLINTGIFVGPTPVGLATLMAAFYPAQLDPKFSDADVPLGYATTQPGSRDQFFHLPAADPATVALDEALKDTATLGEAVTFPHWVPFTHRVDVPVLSVMGDRDILFCSPVCEPGGLEEQKEHLFWGPQTCLEVEILRDSAHFVQLHPDSAGEFRVIVADWIERRVGRDDASAPTGPCEA